MHENDRTSTGFLHPAEFEAVADQFFTHPAQSVRGWETAIEAQRRIVGESERVLSGVTASDVLFVGHGAVATLLYGHYARLAISRRYDQPSGGGNYFSVHLRHRCCRSRCLCRPIPLRGSVAIHDRYVTV